MPRLERIILPLVGPEDVDYISEEPNPYFDGAHKIETYKTKDGQTEIWIDKDTGALVQVGPNHSAEIVRKEYKDIGQAERRRRCQRALFSRGIDTSRLHPLEDKADRKAGLIFFFRWDDFNGPVHMDEMPPFVQFGVRANGELVSFTDTMTLRGKTCACCLKAPCTNSCASDGCDGPDECRGLIEAAEYRDFKNRG